MTPCRQSIMPIRKTAANRQGYDIRPPPSYDKRAISLLTAARRYQIDRERPRKHSVSLADNGCIASVTSSNNLMYAGVRLFFVSVSLQFFFVLL